MNIDSLKIIREFKKNNKLTQEEISEICKTSLVKTNRLINLLISEGLLLKCSNGYLLTEKANNILEPYCVDNAIIMAAGVGSRFVPLSYETPKGLLEVRGERMIERQIKQLIEMSITDITIVVGYLKEKFEYLINKFGVKLVYNDEYKIKNNLSTLYHVRHLLKNTYILSSDNYMTNNLFNTYEFESWYCAVKSEGETEEWCLKTNDNGKIEQVKIGGRNTWHMYGPAFFSQNFSNQLVPLLKRAYEQPGTEDFYWEDILKNNLNELDMYINRQPNNTVYEFESLEELREFDLTYQEQSNNKVLSLICSVFKVKEEKIRDIKPVKIGMTNKTFTFNIFEKKYICRIPGEGTDKLINRDEEYNCIQAVIPLNITEEIVYIDPSSGIKISEFEMEARSLNLNSNTELFKSMKVLNRLHNSNIIVPHSFDIEKNILFYEELCNRSGAILFEDHAFVRTMMSELLLILKNMDIPSAFCHIDAHFENFLVLQNGNLKLIDWEYAGMCDPLIDISMFALYGNLNNKQIEKLMIYYFERDPTYEERLRVYIYIALGGFLWGMWAQYKKTLGVEFGEYTLTMNRFAKDYYKKSMDILMEVKIYEVAKK